MIESWKIRNYFQKSRVFLYPALEIKKGATAVPEETYMVWEDQYKKEDNKLICFYELRDDDLFRSFEKNKLFGNKLFYDFKQVDNNRGVYIFNLDKFRSDWDKILRGKYSLLSTDLRNKIKILFGRNNSNYSYIDSFMNPSNYYGMYSEILGVSVGHLREVGELCPLPDIDKETLTVSIKNINLNINQIVK